MGSRIVENSKYLFNKESYKSAERLNRILIKDYNGSIMVAGLMKNNFVLSVNSEWRPLIPTDGLLSGVQRGFNVFREQGLFNAGAWTRKSYVGGGYLILNLEFRIVAENESLVSPVLIAAKLLTDKTAPQLRDPKDVAFREQAKVVKDYAGKIATSISDTISDNVPYGKEFIDSIRPSIPSTGNVAEKLLNSTLTTNPKPVTVFIGDYFKMGNLVVEGVDVDFSREEVDNGPLYGDFRVRVSSRDVISSGSENNPILNRIGLEKRASRVSIVDQVSPDFDNDTDFGVA